MKPTYSPIFNWLYLLTAILALSIPIILLTEVIRQDITATVTYHFDFQNPHPLFVEYNPRDRKDKTLPYAKFEDKISLILKQGQAHFKVRLPDLFERVKIKATFTTEEMLEVNLKLPNFDQPRPLERHPLYNYLLSSLPWPHISDSTWTLYQRSEKNHVYQSLEEFFENPTWDKKIGTFVHRDLPFGQNVEQEKLQIFDLEDEGQMLSLDYVITNYKLPQQRGWLFTNEYEREIPKEVLEGGIGAEYKFYLEAYGIRENSKVIFESIDITFIRPPVTLKSFLNFILRSIKGS